MIDEGKRVLAVGGGKGGVGKSLIACNLAVALAERGERVLLIDADFGMANQHTLLGVTPRHGTLHDFLTRKVESLEDLVTPTDVLNLGLIAGTNGHPGEANMAHNRKLRLIRHIQRLPWDKVIVDVGAGLSFNTIDMFNLADTKIVVTSHQMTSIQNAYAFLKAVVHRTMWFACDSKVERKLLEDIVSDGDTARLIDVVSKLHEVEPDLGARMDASIGALNIFAIGNLFHADSDVKTLHALQRLSTDFLGLNLDTLGFLCASKEVERSVADGQALLSGWSPGESVWRLRQMAEELCSSPSTPPTNRLQELEDMGLLQEMLDS